MTQLIPPRPAGRRARSAWAIGAAVAVPVLLATAPAVHAQAAGAEDAHGLWITAEKDAVIEFKACPDAPTSLCGHIVWDKDAGTPADSCGTRVAQYARFDTAAWREGWAYDPRDQKKYKSVLRRKADALHLRAFVGTELLGQTEQLARVSALPATPQCAARSS